MRLSKTVKLDETRAAIINELRVADVRKALAGGLSLAGASVPELLGEKFPEVAALLGDCIVLPKGEALDDLTIAEAEQVIAAFREVNAAFLRLAGIVPATPAAIP